jgi:hypothetical protein
MYAPAGSIQGDIDGFVVCFLQNIPFTQSCFTFSSSIMPDIRCGVSKHHARNLLASVTAESAEFTVPSSKLIREYDEQSPASSL